MVTAEFFGNLPGGIRIPGRLTESGTGEVAGMVATLRGKFPETVRLCRFPGNC